jgi:hypothetical protein
MAFSTSTPVLAVMQYIGVNNPEADAEKLVNGEFNNLGDLMSVDPGDLLKTLEACGLKPKSQAFLKKFVVDQHAGGASARGSSAGGRKSAESVVKSSLVRFHNEHLEPQMKYVTLHPTVLFFHVRAVLPVLLRRRRRRRRLRQ